MIEWTNSLSTGHSCIDADHQKLIGILNDLESALKQGKDRSELRPIIFSLVDYAQEHFAREEALMLKVDCPSRAKNQEEHQVLMAKVDGWQIRMEAEEGASLALEIYRECNAWIKDHILRVDCQLRRCNT